MIARFATTFLLVLASAAPVLAQSSGTSPTTAQPGQPMAPNTQVRPTTAAPLPGVADPMTTNSTTGTVDQEDHCQPPGMADNSNPSADTPTLPRPEAACR